METFALALVGASLAVGFRLLQRPAQGALWILVAIPFDTLGRVRLGGFAFTCLDVVILFAAGAVIFEPVLTRRDTLRIDRRQQVNAALFALLLIAALISVLNAPTTALRELLSRIEAALVFVVVLASVRDRSRLDRFFVLAVWCACVAMIITILTSVFGIEIGEISRLGSRWLGGRLPYVRSAGIFSIYGYLGTYCLVPYALAVGALGHRRLLPMSGERYRKLLNVTVFLILTFGFFITQSRSSWLACVVVLFTTAFLGVQTSGLRARRRALINTAILVVGAIVVLAVLQLPAIWEEAVPAFVEMRPRTVEGRLNQVRVGLEIWRENPFFGSGKGAFDSAYGHASRDVLHNVWVNVLVQHGLFGFTAFVGLLMVPLWRNYRASCDAALDRRTRTICVALFAGTLGNLAEMTFTPALAFQSFWLFLAIANAFPEVMRWQRAASRGAPTHRPASSYGAAAAEYERSVT